MIYSHYNPNNTVNIYTFSVVYVLATNIYDTVDIIVGNKTS